MRVIVFKVIRLRGLATNFPDCIQFIFHMFENPDREATDFIPDDKNSFRERWADHFETTKYTKDARPERGL